MYWHAVNADTRDLLKVIDELAQAKVYASYPPERPYGSLSQLLQDTIGVTSREEAEQTYRKKIVEAAKQTTGEVLPPHVHPDVKIRHQAQKERAEKSGISRYQQIKLDRLARNFHDLHEEVKAGKLSVNRASILAGFIREATPLATLKRAWGKASCDERAAFCGRGRTVPQIFLHQPPKRGVLSLDKARSCGSEWEQKHNTDRL